MSIELMRDVFHFVDRSDGIAAPPAGPVPTFAINCQKKKPTDRHCTNPLYEMRLDQIVLPRLNATAQEVRARLIPQPGGDCKMVIPSISGVVEADYGLTVYGKQTTVACGIQAAFNVSGEGVPLDDLMRGRHVNITNAASQDTGGDSGEAFVAAPVASGFRKLTPADNVACFASSANRTYHCVPDGKYGKMDFSWGGWDLRQSDSLLLPQNTSVSWGKYDDYKTNQTAADENFRKDAARYNPKKDTMEFESYGEPSAPVVCLYDDFNYEGNVACFGPGGADLPEALRWNAKSLSVHGDAVAWVYPQTYGDAGAVYVTTDTPDLGVFPYGAKGNFTNQIAALWIHD